MSITTSDKAKRHRELTALSEEGKTIYALAISEKRGLTDTEQRRIDDIERQLDVFDAEVQSNLREYKDPIIQNSSTTEHRGSDFGAGGTVTDRSWASVCHRAGASFDMGDWTNDHEFYSAVASGRHHPSLKRAMGEDTGSLGGYSVPEPTAARILDSALESEIVRPNARVVSMTSASLKLPAWDDTDRAADGLYGGISAHWEGEHDTLTSDDAKLRQVQLTARKLAFLGTVSSELAEDSPSFSGDFQAALSTAAAFHMDQAFLNGDGVGKPLGILQSNCLVSVAKETSQTADTIVYRNLKKIFARMLPASRTRATWIASNTAIPELLELHASDATTGTHVQVLKESNGQFTIFGRPVIFTEKVPVLGDQGDIVFADLTQYSIGMRAGISLAVSPHVRFTTDELSFRLRVRVDGQPLLASAITPSNGDTLSPFVTLAARG